MLNEVDNRSVQYPVVYQASDAEELRDAFIIFTNSHKPHILASDKTTLKRDVSVYKIDVDSAQRITVYTEARDSFFLIFSDRETCSACADQLMLCCAPSTNTNETLSDSLSSHSSVLRSTSALRMTETATYIEAQSEADTLLTSGQPTMCTDCEHLSHSEALCLYMQTSAFDESFTHVLQLFHSLFPVTGVEFSKIISSSIKTNLLVHTLRNLCAFALYPSHSRLQTCDLIILLKIVNAFLLSNVTLGYELLQYDIKIADPPSAHLRGITPRDDFSIEESSYPHQMIRYLVILQKLLDHRAFSFSDFQESVVLSDRSLVSSIITSLVIYFDGVCNIVSVFFGAPTPVPLKRFFDGSNDMELDTILSISLYTQFQEILESLFILLSGALERDPTPLLKFTASNVKFARSESEIRWLFERHNMQKRVIQYEAFDDEDIIYNVLYLVLIIVDTFNAAANIDSTISKLKVPIFSEADSRVLFSGLLFQLELLVAMIIISVDVDTDENALDVPSLSRLFGTIISLLSTDSLNVHELKGFSMPMASFVDDVITYWITQSFQAGVRPLIMVLRILKYICESSLDFLIGFHPELISQFGNVILFLSMDQRFDVLHRQLTLEITRHNANSSADSRKEPLFPNLHVLLTMETLLRDLIQRLCITVFDISQVLTSIRVESSSQLRAFCSQMSLLSLLYMSDRTFRYSSSVSNSSIKTNYITCTESCLSRIIETFNSFIQRTFSSPHSSPHSSLLLFSAKFLVDLMENAFDAIQELAVFKKELILSLISFISKSLSKIPDETRKDTKILSSISLGLDVLSNINLERQLLRALEGEQPDNLILQSVLLCCLEQSRLLSLFTAELRKLKQFLRKPSVKASTAIAADIEKSMTINMLDVDDVADSNSNFNEQQIQLIVGPYSHDLISMIEHVYDILQAPRLLKPLLSLSKDSLVFPVEVAGRSHKPVIASSITSEIYTSIITVISSGVRCLIDEIFPLFDVTSGFFQDSTRTLLKILPHLLLFSLYKSLIVARTTADFYQPNQFFSPLLNLIKIVPSKDLLAFIDIRLVFMAIDAQNLVFRTLVRHSGVLIETMSAYTMLNSLLTELHDCGKFLYDEVAFSVVSSSCQSSIPNFSSVAILAYLDNILSTLIYASQHNFDSIELQMLILSSVDVFFNCLAPISALHCDELRLDELIDLRDYVESDHGTYSEVLLTCVRQISKNNVLKHVIYKENNEKCNQLLIAAISLAISSRNNEFKALGISFLQKCTVLVILQGLPAVEFFGSVFTSDLCAALKLTLSSMPKNPCNLAEQAIRAFDLGLYFFIAVEKMPLQKRRGLASLSQLQTDYLELLESLNELISSSFLDLTESFYICLFSFLTDLMTSLSRLKILNSFRSSLTALVKLLIETVVSNYQKILKTQDNLSLLFMIINSLYTYLCICMYEETFNLQRKRSKSFKPIATDDSPVEIIGTVIITICTLILNCLQQILEISQTSQTSEENESSFKKIVAILYNISDFGFAKFDCVYISMYTCIGTISYIGLLKVAADKTREHDLQIKCVIRLFKAISNIMENPCHSAFIGDVLKSILFDQSHDFLVLICVCLAIYMRNAKIYKLLVQPYEELAKIEREETLNSNSMRWLLLFKMLKRSRGLLEPIGLLLETSLHVLHCAFTHLHSESMTLFTSFTSFTSGPGGYLLTLILNYFLATCPVGERETLVDCVVAHPNRDQFPQTPSELQAQRSIDILALIMHTAPVQVSDIMCNKNMIGLLISAFQKLFPMLLADPSNPSNPSKEHLAHILMKILTIFSDMALCRKCLTQFHDTENQLLLLIAEFLQKLTHREIFDSKCASLQKKLQNCMTMAVLTLRNAAITAENLSYITMDIKSTKNYVLISAVYEYISLYSNLEVEMDGFTAAAEYLTVIIMHLVTQAEEANADHQAITVVKRYALQLEKKMQTAIRKDICVDECSALLGALNMLP